MASSNRVRVLLKSILEWLIYRPVRLMGILYLIGLLWHLVGHPTVSVLTGDFKNPRRWYIDESSLDPSHFQMTVQYDWIQNTKILGKKKASQPEFNVLLAKDRIIRSLCDGVSLDPHIPCLRHTTDDATTTLDIVTVTPQTAAGVAPVSEAVVVVVPPFQPFAPQRKSSSSSARSSKSQAQFQASVLQLIHRLTYASPWLSKTVLFVAATRNTTVPNMLYEDSFRPVLEHTVTTFLDVYLGNANPHEQRDRIPMNVPGTATGAILRNLIVLDVDLIDPADAPSLPVTVEEAEDYESPNELRILPQGRRGVLPNMDLVFLARTVYERSTYIAQQFPVTTQTKFRYQVVHMVTHQYQSWVERIAEVFEKSIPFMEPLLHILAMEHVLAVGPYPPHAPALARGIDALTIQGYYVDAQDKDDTDPIQYQQRRTPPSPQLFCREQVQRLELVLRSLSNLHERLHHSTSLYLLLSPPHRFIKHEEYLVPNLLIIIPLLVRVVAFLFGWGVAQQQEEDAERSRNQDLRWSVASIGRALLGTILATMALTVVMSEAHLPVSFPVVYGVVGTAAWAFVNGQYVVDRTAVQCGACAVATLLHVALAFGHVSLCFPSALVWTFLLALPLYGKGKSWIVLLCLPLWIATWPGLLSKDLVTPYVRYVQVPLHLLWTICLVPIPIARQPNRQKKDPMLQEKSQQEESVDTDT